MGNPPPLNFQSKFFITSTNVNFQDFKLNIVQMQRRYLPSPRTCGGGEGAMTGIKHHASGEKVKTNLARIEPAFL